MIRSRRTFNSLVIFWAFWPAIGNCAGEVDHQKLLRQVKLPTISLQSRFGYSPQELAKFQEPLRRAEIARIEKAMSGDAADAERWDRLGELNELLGDQGKMVTAGTRAADQYRKLLERDPRNPRLLAGLGAALERMGNDQQAEEALRKAVDFGPGEWRGWAALANLLAQKSLAEMFEGIVEDKNREEGTFDERLERFRQRKDAPERLARGKQTMAGAIAAYDRAVACAPAGEPKPFMLRGLFRMSTLVRFRAVVRTIEKPGTDFTKIYVEEMFAPSGTIADLEEAARRRPDDIFATAQAVSTGLQAAMKSTLENCDWNQSPEERKKALREAMARLEKHSSGNDPVASGMALELLTEAHFYFKEYDGAEENARAALVIDPSRENLRYLLLSILKISERNDDAISFLREYLKTKDSARTHFLIAKLLEGKSPAEAEKELEAALRLDPDDFYANLGMAALIGKKSPAGEDLRRAEPYLDKARAAYLKSPSEDGWREMTISQAIYSGLSAKPAEEVVEQSRSAIKRIIARHPGDLEAREILAALGGGDEAEVSIDEARKYYQAHLEEFASKGQMTFRMISVDEGADAQATLDRIDADLDKMSFEAAARKFYEGRPAEAFLWKKSVESLKDWKQPLAGEILKLKPGEVKRRIALGPGSGWRYVELVTVKPGGTLTFEEARPQIEAAIQSNRAKFPREFKAPKQ